MVNIGAVCGLVEAGLYMGCVCVCSVHQQSGGHDHPSTANRNTTALNMSLRERQSNRERGANRKDVRNSGAKTSDQALAPGE